MKKLLIIFGMLLILSPAFSQFDMEDAQLFGSSRGSNKAYVEFQTPQITTDTYTHEFVLKNTDLLDMKIIGVRMPQGVSVMLPNEIIPAGEEGKVIVTLYKNYMKDIDNKNNFRENVVITTKQKGADGVLITKNYIFRITGSFK